MADDKLNTSPQENNPPEVSASLEPDAPSALEPVKSPSNPLKHEQAVISGMGEEAPAPAGKVIDLWFFGWADCPAGSP